MNNERTIALGHMNVENKDLPDAIFNVFPSAIILNFIF